MIDDDAFLSLFVVCYIPSSAYIGGNREAPHSYTRADSTNELNVSLCHFPSIRRISVRSIRNTNYKYKYCVQYVTPGRTLARSVTTRGHQTIFTHVFHLQHPIILPSPSSTAMYILEVSRGICNCLHGIRILTEKEKRNWQVS